MFLGVVTGVHKLETTKIFAFESVTSCLKIPYFPLSLLLCQSSLFACQHALFHFVFLLRYEFLLPYVAQIEQFDCVGNKFGFDALVQARLCLETRRLIHLNQVRFRLAVQQNVKAENLETQLAFEVVRLTRFVGVVQRGVRRDYSLHNNVAYLPFQLFVVLSVVHQLRKHAFEAAFVRARFIFVVGTLAARILHKILVMLVYRIIRQMHIQIVYVAVIWLFIFFSCHSHKPIFEHENSQRIYAVKQGIDSQIEFLVVNHVRIRNVSLSNDVFVRIHLSWISHKVYSPSLTLRLRLNDESGIRVT